MRADFKGSAYAFQCFMEAAKQDIQRGGVVKRARVLWARPDERKVRLGIHRRVRLVFGQR